MTALGLATTVLSGDLTPATLANAVVAELGRGASPAVSLDFDGVERAGEALASMLGR